MWQLDCEESWAPKNWCFWTVVLEKTLESPLDCKEIQPVHSKGDQSWVFFGRTDAKAETPVLWPPHAKSSLIGKDSDSGRDWGQEEKGTTEDEMAGWHHRLDGPEFEWTPGVGDGQGGLACCNSWGHKESDRTEWLNWTESQDLNPSLFLNFCSSLHRGLSAVFYNRIDEMFFMCIQVSMLGSLLPLNSVFASCWDPWKAAKRRSWPSQPPVCPHSSTIRWVMRIRDRGWVSLPREIPAQSQCVPARLLLSQTNVGPQWQWSIWPKIGRISWKGLDSQCFRLCRFLSLWCRSSYRQCVMSLAVFQ